MTAIPQDILKIKQWTISHSLSELKRPLDSLYRHEGAMNYHKAIIAAGKHKRIGFYVTPKDPYILGDIDHVDDPMNREHVASVLPIGFCDLLFNQSIYSEVSPSGKGIRFIARLKDLETKEQLVGDYRKNRDPMGFDKSGQKREAQINIGRPWQTITGNTTPYSSTRISVIETDVLLQLFNYTIKNADVVGTDYRPPPVEQSYQIPSIQSVVKALHSLPWDSNPRLLRSFKLTFGEEYSSYEYWLKVIMAMSDYASKVNSMNDTMRCLEEITKWSAKDEEGYTGEEEIVKKWESLMRTESRVTYHTLLSLVHYNTLIWPQKKPLTAKQIKAGVTTTSPLVSQYANFKAMVDFYGLVLYQDVNSVHKKYLVGDDDILEKYFSHLSTHMYHGKYLGPWSMKTLVPKFHAMCQDHGYIAVTSNQIQQNLSIWLGEMNKTIDLVKLFFDTPYDDLVDEYKENGDNLHISNVEFLFDSLTIDHITDDPEAEDALYFTYYKSWLMGIARNIFYPNSMHMNNCVLLLTGPEQIRKTSHFKFILPKFMRDERVAFTPHGFSTEASVRDVTKLASMNNLIVWDEIEQFLTTETESNFKKLIDNNPVKLIDKYEVLDTYVKPIAVYGGTSNQREFQLSDNGSRRLFIIPVKWVDTDAMAKVNWWKIINDLKDEIAGAPLEEPPWLLSEEQLQFQAHLHGKITSKSSLDLILEEMFDFTERWLMEDLQRLPKDFNFRTAPYLWSSAQIANRIKASGVVWSSAQIANRIKASGVGGTFSRKHLVNVLKRMCSSWTRTARARRTFKDSHVTVHKGETMMNGRAKFWMPPLIKLTETRRYFDGGDAENF